MTESEGTLIVAMMLNAARVAGEYCRDSGYPPPTTDQIAEMRVLWQKAFITFVTALSAQGLPDREPTEYELAQIEAVVIGTAQGAVVRVLGESPGFKARAN